MRLEPTPAPWTVLGRDSIVYHSGSKRSTAVNSYRSDQLSDEFGSVQFGHYLGNQCPALHCECLCMSRRFSIGRSVQASGTTRSFFSFLLKAYSYYVQLLVRVDSYRVPFCCIVSDVPLLVWYAFNAHTPSLKVQWS
jgi:hypothetical protein